MASCGGVSDSGLSTAAYIAQAAAAAVAGYQVNAAISIAEKQEQLAKGYLGISQEENNYYYNTYAPCEDTELEEACSAVTEPMHLDTSTGRYIASIRHQFVGKTEKELACNSRYCTGRAAAIIRDNAIQEASAAATAANMARRYEEARYDAKDDLRWNRREQALNRGRDMMAQALTFSGIAYGVFGELGTQAAYGAAGAIGYLGYTSTRRPTVYPTMRSVQRNVPDISYPLPSPTIEQIPQSPARPAPEGRIRG